ncbi:glutamate 5-kinase [Tepidibacter sp. Z1-5]|uniref:glutamate 5-kinase n=1 Tax=Tepidibacter sp. Z1-5 TaxID=3134138 RepID=UPI0030BA5080
MKLKKESYLKNVKRIVVKIGTSTLTHSTGLLNLNTMENIVRQLVNIHNQGIEVVLVTSGAIGAGMGKLGLKSKPKTIPQKQAAAAVGQGILMHMYEKLFSEYGKIAAQILLTSEDMSDRKRFLNARNTFFSLFNQKVIPIVNENDAIAIDEIKFGDNDTLSAMVTTLVDGDLLLVLSDIDGLYNANPKTNINAKLISYVEEITEKIKCSAGDAGSNLGTGGMITKLKAAEIAVSSGASMIIANGSILNIINRIFQGENIGTFFQATKNPLQSKKSWIAYNTAAKGKIIIDDGAKKAILEKRKSLLPSGVKSVNGKFNKGDVVYIVDSEYKEIARGITNYNSLDIDLIKGIQTSDITDQLGYKNYDEIIHVNNLVILNND